MLHSCDVGIIGITNSVSRWENSHERPFMSKKTSQQPGDHFETRVANLMSKMQKQNMAGKLTFGQMVKTLT